MIKGGKAAGELGIGEASHLAEVADVGGYATSGILHGPDLSMISSALS